MSTEKPNADDGITQSNVEEEKEQSNGAEGGITDKRKSRAKSVTLLHEPDKAVAGNSGMFLFLNCSQSPILLHEY